MKKTLKISSWNVNGVRACLKNGLPSFITQERPDILCLQETKADSATLADICKSSFPDYLPYISSAKKKGYSGVLTLVHSSIAPTVKSSSSGFENTALKLFEDEGRFSLLEFDEFYLINVYIPSGTSGEERQVLKYSFLELFLEELKKSLLQYKNVVVCGDFNICHKEIDIHHPKQATRLKLTGFLPEERAWMDRLVDSGLVDCFRKCSGDESIAYTWWSYRAQSRPKNLGWRIDYFFCSPSLACKLSKALIHSRIAGSDHCPITILLDF